MAAADGVTPVDPRRSISLIAPNWLGDAVMSLPLVGLLAGSDRTVVSVIAPEATARVYWGVPGLDELVVLPKHDGTRGVRSRAGYLRRTRPDAAVVLPPSLSAAAGPWLARVPVRVGYRTDGRGGLLTDALAPHHDRDVHLSEELVRLGEATLARLEIARPERYDAPSVRVGEADHRQLNGLFGDAAPERYAVLVPGATYGPAKSWPWRRYRELARALAKEVTVALAGTAAEREMCERVANGSENIRNLAGETSLGAFLSLLSRACVVVANDSGAPHLAASMGTPVVVLFGSTSPAWTAPQGRSVVVVRHPVPCSPCFRKTCPTQLECFEEISVDEVLERARRHL